MCKISVQPPVLLAFYRPVCKLAPGCHFRRTTDPIDLEFLPVTRINEIRLLAKNQLNHVTCVYFTYQQYTL